MNELEKALEKIRDEAKFEARAWTGPFEREGALVENARLHPIIQKLTAALEAAMDGIDEIAENCVDAKERGIAKQARAEVLAILSSGK